MTDSRMDTSPGRGSRIDELTDQLTEARKELEELSYAVSHDLRAPLRTVFGFTQLLVKKYRDRLEGQALDYLERIGSGAARMERMIEDLLRLSRTGRMDVQREEVDATAIARSVVEELQAADPKRPCEIDVQEGMRLDADPRQLRMVFQSLLENAWKFTRHVASPRIEVRVQQMNAQTFCCVRDNGAGFTMNQADRLFRPFQRLHLESEFPGTGIGLAIVKKIVDRHGGRVMAEGAEGHGAMFCFSLGGERAKVTGIPEHE